MKGEHKMTYNQRTMTVKLERIDVCDLMLACTVIADETGAEKWSKLHDKLLAMIDAFDEKNGIGVSEQ